MRMAQGVRGTGTGGLRGVERNTKKYREKREKAEDEKRPSYMEIKGVWERPQSFAEQTGETFKRIRSYVQTEIRRLNSAAQTRKVPLDLSQQEAYRTTIEGLAELERYALEQAKTEPPITDEDRYE
jgi:hypothetical protein